MECFFKGLNIAEDVRKIKAAVYYSAIATI